MTNNKRKEVIIRQCYEGLCKGLKLKGVPHRPSLAQETGEQMTANMAYFRSELEKANAEIDKLRGRSLFGRVRAVFIPAKMEA